MKNFKIMNLLLTLSTVATVAYGKPYQGRPSESCAKELEKSKSFMMKALKERINYGKDVLQMMKSSNQESLRDLLALSDQKQIQGSQSDYYFEETQNETQVNFKLVSSDSFYSLGSVQTNELDNGQVEVTGVKIKYDQLWHSELRELYSKFMFRGNIQSQFKGELNLYSFVINKNNQLESFEFTGDYAAKSWDFHFAPVTHTVSLEDFASLGMSESCQNQYDLSID